MSYFGRMLRYLWIPIALAAGLMACGGEEPAESTPDFRSSNATAAASTGPDGERIYKTGRQSGERLEPELGGRGKGEN